MKKLISFFVIVSLINGVYAQENVVKDKKEETVTTRVIVNNGKSLETVTVKEETTTEKQQVKLSDKENHYENQNIEYTPSESKKRVLINNDVPSYININNSKRYIYNNKAYRLVPDNTGFYIASNNGSAQTRVAKLRKTNAKNYYVAIGNGFSGIGYFDEQGNLTLEYPQKSGNLMVVQRYRLMQ